MRLERGTQLAIVLLVGAMAGAASFTHVHDWTMAHSPDGAGDWFGWANAVISELTPTAALLEFRRRRGRGESIRYPLALLVCSACLSLVAQVARADPSLSGWTVAALPAVALLALSKLVLAGAPTPAPPRAPAVRLASGAAVVPAVVAPDRAPESAPVVPPTAAPEHPTATPAPAPRPRPARSAPTRPAPATRMTDDEAIAAIRKVHPAGVPGQNEIRRLTGAGVGRADKLAARLATDPQPPRIHAVP